jgi:hypothetical protein
MPRSPANLRDVFVLGIVILPRAVAVSSPTILPFILVFRGVFEVVGGYQDHRQPL